MNTCPVFSASVQTDTGKLQNKSEGDGKKQKECVRQRVTVRNVNLGCMSSSKIVRKTAAAQDATKSVKPFPGRKR